MTMYTSASVVKHREEEEKGRDKKRDRERFYAEETLIRLYSERMFAGANAVPPKRREVS